MEDNKFCQIFLYSLMNFVCFMLATIFLTTLFNLKSQIILLQLGDEEKKSYENSLKAIKALFSFEFFGFCAFMIFLMIFIKKRKVNKVESYRNKIKMSINVNQNIQNQNIQNQNRVILDDKYNINTNEQINTDNIPNIQNFDIQSVSTNNPEEEKPTIFCLEKTMLFLFIYCQIIYIIEVIVLTAYFSKSTKLEKNFESKEEGKYFSNRYRDLIIVGYIFFAIFILIDLFTFVTKSEINQENEINLKKIKYCDFCSQWIIETCTKMANTFKNCIKSPEDIQAEIQEIQKKVGCLENRINIIKDINNKIKNGVILTKEDLEGINLPAYECNITKIITTQSL